MKAKSLFLLVTATVMWMANASPAGAVLFTFDFDNRGVLAAPPATPPFVGTGTVTLATDPGPGTFALSSLEDFSMAFVFGPVTFPVTFSASTGSTSQITTRLDQVLVVITSVPGGENLQFSNLGFRLGLMPTGALLDFDLIH